MPSEANVPDSIEPLNENSVTSVGPATTMCAFCKPIKLMNSPIPTDTAIFSDGGIALKIASRILTSDSKIKIMPSTKIAANACCHV